ncbi:hypothetical protein VOLCADRAFT_106008 [Volvox carteri f. nagariensis]|uniref:Uncharacterized protein n=1 Tax=Volvox carteri f. nagariensis TaxID=3068 RepID=D8U485_VOLCA|nr:uncharacterized protein VOLCADRAFT_106008 [Volvox carteri f. nagariensis]EFJ45547.1 hypothetical protein VOLCADRAFT_106008 [Volvox carteri f. nagariensis]|eukprot:XP_002953574.1 hypothetical protein VOLCADRAFT_106008 [Volvox carteri f. nagariensis]
MSEADAVNGTLADTGIDEGDALDATNGEMGQLDEEATALLKELEDSQLEVQRMLEAQRAQAQELGGMKDHLSAELLQLKDDAWKLHLFAELEMLKRQLAAINNLDADLDAMEAKLDAEEGDPDEAAFQEALAEARAGTQGLLARLGGSTSRPARPLLPTADGEDAASTSMTGGSGGGAESKAAAAPVGGAADAVAAAEKEDEEVAGEAVEDVEALQEELDAELDSMMKQLQAIKAESAMVAARKAQLEMELMQLMRDEADDLTSQLRDLGVGSGEGEGQAGANGGGETAAAEAAGGDAAAPP